MPLANPVFWSEHLRNTLKRYDEPLLRRISSQLFKPRNQWPTEELIERSIATVGNAAAVDRRLQELDPAARKLLALIGHSRQPRWRLGNLFELLVALGHPVAMRPVLMLFESGLLYPDLPDSISRLKSFEQWLGAGSGGGLAVFAHPHVTGRALGEDLGLPDLSEREAGGEDRKAKGPGSSASGSRAPAVPPTPLLTPREADGLEWPLRLAALAQRVATGPLRRTQQGDFFKRDLDRLRADPLLNGPPANYLVALPDLALLAVELGLVEGLLDDSGGEIRAASFPKAWDQGLLATLESLWAAVPQLETWNAQSGWQPGPVASNPYPSAYLLALLLLARLPGDRWVNPALVEQWIVEHHPFWAAPKIEDRAKKTEVRPLEVTQKPQSSIVMFLLGVAYELRMLQALREADGHWLVRLSGTGRWLVGMAGTPPATPGYAQTLLVQPNLEIVAYRQGLTPALIARLGQVAAWKSLGAACILQFEADTVYRALENGQTFAAILQTLEQHSVRPTPPAVIESLRTWANKRERLGVYPSATLFEFNSPEDLNEALARGLPGLRLSEWLVLVTDERAVDFRHFRLTATRDYGLPLEPCVKVEKDGVTLTIDLAHSDLLLETELPRFAERLETAAVDGRRQYRLTPGSLRAGQQSGLGFRVFEEWFVQRTGQPLTPAARLLLMGPLFPQPELRRQLVLHVSTQEVADGLMQWPITRVLIQARLGPTALAIAQDHVTELQARLQELGMSLLL